MQGANNKLRHFFSYGALSHGCTFRDMRRLAIAFGAVTLVAVSLAWWQLRWDERQAIVGNEIRFVRIRDSTREVQVLRGSSWTSHFTPDPNGPFPRESWGFRGPTMEALLREALLYSLSDAPGACDIKRESNARQMRNACEELKRQRLSRQES